MHSAPVARSVARSRPYRPLQGLPCALRTPLDLKCAPAVLTHSLSLQAEFACRACGAPGGERGTGSAYAPPPSPVPKIDGTGGAQQEHQQTE